MKANKIKNQITITLPVPIYKSQLSIEEALQRRRSVRKFKNEPITLQQVALGCSGCHFKSRISYCSFCRGTISLRNLLSERKCYWLTSRSISLYTNK